MMVPERSSFLRPVTVSCGTSTVTGTSSASIRANTEGVAAIRCLPSALPPADSRTASLSLIVSA